MAKAKAKRDKKRQLGQFMTPHKVASHVVESFEISVNHTVLEPSMGDGSFIISLIDAFLPLYSGSIESRLEQVLNENIYGIEIDPEMYEACLLKIRSKYGFIPIKHNLILSDFFTVELPKFDFIIGNPPFGGTFNAEIEDGLDAKYGSYNGHKVKKETYSFFIVKCLGLLNDGGRLGFICSDTFLTINTMRGLRLLLMDEGRPSINTLSYFSEETQQPMVVLTFIKGNQVDDIVIDGEVLERSHIEKTANFSWGIRGDLTKYFHLPDETLSKYIIATSGMTIGKNELFLREIQPDNSILEPYSFEFFEEPITLSRELERARLGKMSESLRKKFQGLEKEGATRRNVRIVEETKVKRLTLPHASYQPYNKAQSRVVYSPPTHVVYWENDGDAVLTFKKNGPWYLHGVGGKKFFGMEGITWQLVSQRLNARYLPPGFILDSGAPLAVLRPGIQREELWFILGWLLSPLAEKILKEVINHTRNIQGKDVERLPYPFWVTQEDKLLVIRQVAQLVESAQQGAIIDRKNVKLQEIFEIFMKYKQPNINRPKRILSEQPRLF